MALLDGVAWEGKVFKGGAWTDGRGGTYPVVEPATGDELGTMGLADAEDVAEAAASAAEAQKEWAALPHTARAAVLRRAGDLWAEHADEIRDWNVREVGAIPPMADFAMHVAAEECYQAASLPGQPIGQVLPSELPRLSMAPQRLPGGVPGVPALHDPLARARPCPASCRPVWSLSSRPSTPRSSSASGRSPRRSPLGTPCS